MQKELQQKISKKRFVHEMRMDPRNFGSTGEHNLRKSSKSFAKMKEKVPPKRMRLRVHLLNVQYHISKMIITVTSRLMPKIIFPKCLKLSRAWFPENNCLKVLIPKFAKYFFFSALPCSNALQKKTQEKKWGQSSHLEVRLTIQGGLCVTVSTESFWSCCNLLQKPTTYTTKDDQDEVIRGLVHQKELLKDIQKCNRLQMKWFPMHLHSYLETIHLAVLQSSSENNWI